MAISFSLTLLLLCLTTAAPTAVAQGTHLGNIIDALIGAGDFAGWANLLSIANPASLPLSATFFIPGNAAVSNLTAAAGVSASIDGFLIAYHIVPQRLTFSDLQRLVIRTRLPTLLPSKYIVVTDNSTAMFAVDGSRITHPDAFLNAAFTVHGVEKLLNYSVYGDGRVPSPPPPPPPPPPDNKTSTGVESRPPQERTPVLPGLGEAKSASGRSSLCSWGLMIFPILDLLEGL